MFYATWCPFSAKAAPHYNALARMFPDIIFLAADIQRHQAYTTQFGVLALPTILLFHNSKTIVKFNHSDYELANFTTFLNIFTGEYTFSGPWERFLPRGGPNNKKMKFCQF